MTYRIAINGFGRIGRNYLRRLVAKDLANAGLQVVAIPVLLVPPAWPDRPLWTGPSALTGGGPERLEAARRRLVELYAYPEAVR